MFGLIYLLLPLPVAAHMNALYLSRSGTESIKPPRRIVERRPVKYFQGLVFRTNRHDRLSRLPVSGPRRASGPFHPGGNFRRISVSSLSSADSRTPTITHTHTHTRGESADRKKNPLLGRILFTFFFSSVTSSSSCYSSSDGSSSTWGWWLVIVG